LHAVQAYIDGLHKKTQESLSQQQYALDPLFSFRCLPTLTIYTFQVRFAK
jgi:hypothetical protein